MSIVFAMQTTDMSTRPPSPFPDETERRASRAAKRHALLLAAVRMFNDRGFHATSLDDVAATLGVSKPTIYHHLGNKDQVLLECVSMGLAQLHSAAATAAAKPGTGMDRLRDFLIQYACINMDDFGRCVIRTGEEVLSTESAARFKALKREIDVALRDLIGAGMADGSIAMGDIRLVAFTLAGALNWPARWFDPKGPIVREAVADQMVSILTAGLLPR